MAATYAWIIDKDHLYEPGVDLPDHDEAGTQGPSAAPVDLTSRLTLGGGFKFRMYDDDGILYYSGRLVLANRSVTLDEAEEHEAFGPLHDFGLPNAGAVRIDYYDEATGKWAQL